MSYKRLNNINAMVIATTFVLFVLALFFKGLTHDILLEVAIFLVSVKLILATQKSNYDNAIIKQKLDDINNKLN